MQQILSKTKYCRGIQCPKMLWMDINKPEVAQDTGKEAILRNGTAVGEFARGYFGEFVEVESTWDKKKMCEDTERLMKEGHESIAEASFEYEGCFCSVDILHRVGDDIDIVEVKSSTEVHEIYLYDMAYQYYVLTHCGIRVSHVYNLHINNEYVRQGELEIKELFALEDCTRSILPYLHGIDENICSFKKYQEMTDEPDTDIDIYCDKPYECVYKQYCFDKKGIPGESVFNIHRLAVAKKYDLYHNGIISYPDIIQKKPLLNEKQWRQVEVSYNNELPKIEKASIKAFLDKLSYPLYHLDFETFQQAIPEYDGIRPYMQIPFQYSLHVQHTPQGEPEHFEFLAKEGTDPRRALAESLVRDIPENVCSMAYNMTFEKTVIRNLAELFPDLKEHLMNIHDNMKDLMVPFRDQSYYCKEMKGSYSIKWVLPALCGDDPELDYHALEGIHNGSEAMDAFAVLAEKTPEEISRIRRNLLAYCRLDTLAMVKVLNKLYECCGI